MLHSQDQLSLSCPTCREVTALPANGVTGLKSDFRSNIFLEVLNEHRRNGICPEHDERVKFFCKTCQKCICYKGVIIGGEHHSHSYTDISKSYEKYQEEAGKLLEEMETRASTITNALAGLDRYCDETACHRAAIKTKIQDRAKQLHEMIDKRQNELISQSEQITSRKLNYLAIQRDQIEALQSDLSGWQDFIKKTLTEQPQYKTLEMWPTKQINEQTEPFVFAPVTDMDTEFSISTDVETLCQSYGEVSSPNLPDPSTCFATGRGTEEAVVGQKATAILSAASFKGTPYVAVIASAFFSVELVSEMTSSKVNGSIEHRGQGQYLISYQPTVKGRHQLHIKADGQHIRGSPFHVIVKLPIEKLGTPILTLKDVKAPKGVAINGKGEVVVAESDAHCVSVFSPCGEKRSFGTHGSGDGEFENPHGVAVDGEGNIVVTDYDNHRIQKFSADGHFLKSVGGRGDGALKFKNPTDIAYSASNGKVYVADKNHSIQILNSDLTFSRRFGREGYGTGQFDTACGVAVDSTGRVYVADSGNHRIQVFTANGKFLRMFGHKGTSKGELGWPRGIAVDGSGLVYISEYNNHRVSVFTSEGEFLTSIGSSELVCPFGLAVDNIGVVYVCDSFNNHIQMF